MGYLVAAAPSAKLQGRGVAVGRSCSLRALHSAAQPREVRFKPTAEPYCSLDPLLVLGSSVPPTAQHGGFTLASLGPAARASIDRVAWVRLPCRREPRSGELYTEGQKQRLASRQASAVSFEQSWRRPGAAPRNCVAAAEAGGRRTSCFQDGRSVGGFPWSKAIG